MTLPITLTLACIACVLGQIVADRRAWPLARGVFKLGASSCFVGVAIALGATQSGYGQLVLGALLLGWVGDALLLSRRTPAFMAGLGAFLLSHGLFAAAFASGALAWQAMGVAMVVASAVGAVFLRWLLPRVPGQLKPPVLAYVVVILAMCVTATGHTVATERWIVLLGALLFAVSDVAVARDRFVQRSHANHVWGWATYFAAQLLLAWSVVGA
ncbi:MAG: lysoplasmalogenase [Hydrogenophaga sp.]|nr:lysoplasmalogenase [Hydrogenophaga sp.]